MNVQNLFVNDVETIINTSSIKFKFRDMTIIAKGVNADVKLTIFLDVYGLGKIESDVKLKLKNFNSQFTLPIESYNTSTALLAKISRSKI